jgi:3-methyladenine DNA glycosylase AlkD
MASRNTASAETTDDGDDAADADDGRAVQRALRTAFAAAGSPERAAAQQAYMKSAMPFFGVPMAEVKRIAKEIAKQHPPKTPESWQHTCLRVWREAEHREERYFCETWSGLTLAKKWQTPSLMPMYEEMIVSGAWWDLVDWLAAHRVGGLLARHRAEVAPVLRRWSIDDNLWRRRTAILSQLRHKGDTDFGFLVDVITPSLEPSIAGTQRTATEKFFLRKAIGWALRAHSDVDADAVAEWVAEQGDALSGLSRREALKHL